MMAELYSHDSSPFDAGRARRTAQGLLGEPDFGTTWLIEVEGKVAGYLVLVLGYSLEFGGRFGLLDELFVLEDYRGSGIGAEALAFASRQARERGWGALRLEVGQSNARAISVYRRAGFEMHERYLMTKWV